MSLPIASPATNGPGRLTEVAYIRKNKMAAQEFQKELVNILEKTSKFPIFKQVMFGDTIDDEDGVLLVFDWTSAEEKAAFKSSQEYQSVLPLWSKITDIKNPETTVYHATFPGSSATPKCTYCEVAMLKVPVDGRDRFAAAMKHYIESPPPNVFRLFSVSQAEEDPEAMICLFGFDDEKAADIADKSEEHMEAKKVNDPMVKGWFKHKSRLQILTTAAA